ncbi:MAG: M28 family peptidase, partial [Candidatus Eremiobacteraeota bacterium]|nr:M28 family peptidase [Candidatus Eremiobacteraeota bacterium]
MPSRRLVLLGLAVAAAATLPAAAAIFPPPRDPAIVAALARIDPARLRADDERLVGFGTRSTFSENQGPNRGYTAARDWLAAQFREIAATSSGRMTVGFDNHTEEVGARRIPRDVLISSVVATLRGDEGSNRVFVMSSHLDSRNSSSYDATKDAPGADDNGSGTAAVLEVARALATVPLHATVIFACYDAEEQNLYGSAHHAALLRAQHIDVQGDLNNDIIGASVGDDGRRRADTIRIFSEALPAGSDPARLNVAGGENDSPSRQLARYAKETGDAYPTGLHGMLVFRQYRFLRGGDHVSFNAQGFAAVRFTEPVEDFRHQHQDVRVENGVQFGDLIRYVDFDYLAKVARYNGAALASLALAPPAPAPNIVTTGLTNDTTLIWAPVARAARYEVVRRLTTDADWIASQDVGTQT